MTLSEWLLIGNYLWLAGIFLILLSIHRKL
jgi:hypothetical protein